MKSIRLLHPIVIFAAAVMLWRSAFAVEETANPGPQPSAEEQRAYDELAKRGVSAQAMALNVNWRYVNFRGAANPDAPLFALLKPCTLIADLDLSGTPVSDADLANLEGLKNLKRLSLARCPVTDAGLAHLKTLDQLESLNLFGTGVTDAGLANLNGLKNLKRLYVFETKVTEAGAQALEKVVAGLKVDTGWKLPLAEAKLEEKKAAPTPPVATPAKPVTPPPPEVKPEEKKPVPAATPPEPKPAAAAATAAKDPGPGPQPAPEELKAYEELAKRGVSAEPLAADLNWRYVNFRDLKKPDTAVFALLKSCSLLVELNLSGVSATEADLASLAGLKNLAKLNLANSTVTDAGLANLKDLDQLETLNLYHTGITDAGLTHLNGLKNLKRLYVFETKVTDAGAKALQEAMPGVKIELGTPIPRPEPKVEDKNAPPAPPAAKPEEKKPAEVPSAPPAAKPAEAKPEEKKPAPPEPAPADKKDAAAAVPPKP